jgi:exodeoxyribonuclease VII small subunit
MNNTDQSLTYDQALRELQGIVDLLQEESSNIDELSQRVRRAAALVKYCREKLRSTEDAVQQLLQAE